MGAKKGNIPWNKGKKMDRPQWNTGLTKETHPGLMKMSLKKTGVKLSKDHKVKIGISGTGTNVGEDNPMWKGGRNIYWKKKLKKVYTTCVLCSGIETLEMHHKDSDVENTDRNNLIIICRECHEFWHHT